MNGDIDSLVKVLLIEDTTADYELIAGMLESHEETRYEVTRADRLASGLRLLSSGSFDVVLLDLFLPETKGLRTMEKLFERAPHMVVVVLTKLDDELAGLEAVRHGAQEYLVKMNFDADTLRRAIRHAIERSRIEAKLRASEKKHRQLISQLQAANKELESFSYSVSHDLRAPLRAITGFAEILDRRFRQELPEKAVHYLDNIIKAGNQMGELIDELLAYSRLGKGSISYENVNLSELFDKIVSSLDHRIKERQAQITVSPELPTIKANASLLHQVFANLINNALTFVKPGTSPCVEVGCVDENNDLIITVSDNGIGISEDQFERIFNVFQRLHAQETYPGTGIGLSIVQKALFLLNGEVSVASTPGKGSTFSVRLPYK